MRGGARGGVGTVPLVFAFDAAVGDGHVDVGQRLGRGPNHRHLAGARWEQVDLLRGTDGRRGCEATARDARVREIQRGVRGARANAPVTPRGDEISPKREERSPGGTTSSAHDAQVTSASSPNATAEDDIAGRDARARWLVRCHRRVGEECIRAGSQRVQTTGGTRRRNKTRQRAPRRFTRSCGLTRRSSLPAVRGQTTRARDPGLKSDPRARDGVRIQSP